jgi:hypothetical protein
MVRFAWIEVGDPVDCKIRLTAEQLNVLNNPKGANPKKFRHARPCLWRPATAIRSPIHKAIWIKVRVLPRKR